MTACVIIAGLAPILWSHGAGADVMKRIATPMVGGVVTSNADGTAGLSGHLLSVAFTGHPSSKPTTPNPVCRRSRRQTEPTALVYETEQQSSRSTRSWICHRRNCHRHSRAVVASRPRTSPLFHSARVRDNRDTDNATRPRSGISSHASIRPRHQSLTRRWPAWPRRFACSCGTCGEERLDILQLRDGAGRTRLHSGTIAQWPQRSRAVEAVNKKYGGLKS